MHLKKIFIFLGIFALILVVSQCYMFQRINYYLQMTKDQRVLTVTLLSSLSLLTLIALPVSRLLPRVVATILAWIVYPWMGITFLMFITFLAADLIWLLLQLVPEEYIFESRVLLRHNFGMAALTIIGLLGGFALWKGLKPVTVKPLTVVLKRLPSVLDGLRIVQITDLHIGPMINGDWLRRVVDKVNGLKSDLIVITGDLVDGSVKELRQHVASLADLRAAHGVFFVTGNHEYYSGVDQWCDHLTSLGIHVLRNECVSILCESEDASFDLAGVDDWASHHFQDEGPNLPKALASRNPNNVLILLAHQPAAVHEAAAHGVDLQLSGHTHGGQMWPFTYLVYLQQPYAKGLYHYADTETQLYVSSGTGFWGPPMRLGTSAEITHITLRSVE